MPRYRTVRVPLSHPMANRNTSINNKGTTVQAWEHRVVLYDVIGPGPHECHWCGRLVDWGEGCGPGVLVVDHLNGDRLDNWEYNLVPSCQSCNIHRAKPNAIQDGELTLIGSGGRRVRAVERKCEFCNIEFVALQSQVNIGSARFCSRECAREGGERPHIQPGELFLVKNGRRHRAVEVDCEFCGKQFLAIKNRARCFCSQDCSHKGLRRRAARRKK